MAIAIADFIKQISDLTDSDISDQLVEQLASFAWSDLMSRIQKREVKEKVQYIDRWRLNTIDGTNTTFYTQNSYYRYMGDLNLDMALTIDDVEVWEYKNDSTISQMTLATISTNGYFTTTVAPAAGSEVFITYSHLPISFSPTIDIRIRNALAFVTTSLCYGKLDPGDYEAISFRGLGVRRARKIPNLHLGTAYDSWMARYMALVDQINSMQCILRKDDMLREYNERVRPTYMSPPQ